MIILYTLAAIGLLSLLGLTVLAVALWRVRAAIREQYRHAGPYL